MSLFAKLSKNSDKTIHPWSQKKVGGTNNALPRSGHAAAVTSFDSIIVFGGVHRGSSKKDLLHIDTNTMSATNVVTTGDVPSARTSHMLLYINGHVLLYGGKSITTEDYDPSVYFLNLQNKQWNRLSMEGHGPIERSGHSSAVHENMVYIWGGQNQGRYFNDMLSFNTSLAPRWNRHTYDVCPEARAGHISAIYEDKMYIFGGTNGNQLFGDLWSLDLPTGIWSKVEDAEGVPPMAREGCASAMIDDVIYILGGKNDKGKDLNDLCGFKIKDRRWYTFHKMGPTPSPRHGLTMSAIRDRLFVFGGDNDSSKMEDGSLMYILDSTKIKYPIEAPHEEKVLQSQQVQSYNDLAIDPQHPYASQPHLMPQQSYSSPQPQQSYSTPQPYQPSSLSYHPQQTPQPYSLGSQQPKYQQAIEQKRSLQSSPQRTPLKASIETNMAYNEGQQPPPTASNSTGIRHRSLYPETQPPVRPPRHMSSVPEAALRRPRAGSSPHPPDLAEIERMAATEEDPVHLPPPRPPREASRIIDEIKDEKERQLLMREIKARDAVINEMKKKESWWRAEVSLARKLFNKAYDDGPDADEALLMDVDHLSEDRVKLFEQLVSVKSELRRVRAGIQQQASPMSDKVQQADRMRTAALQEAAYFKSKYLALKARRHDELGLLDLSRSDELEKRLALALTENETKNKSLQQLQKRSLHDQNARLATEERAKEAQERAEEAQQAHQRALEELQTVYERATRAENQVRENAVKVADLTQQLSEALTNQPTIKSQEVSDAQLKASQLEAANLKARNESAALRQRLAESMDDIARLQTSLNERDDSLNEARLHIEDYEIQLNMLRDAMNQKSSVNGFSPTTAY
ncbi:hypothetical protein BY458DRAFT_480719 [Sporodiniella umbellata]|nr:hypothetical protein BY458DRAFT_480719 [Sporodiniella umbellata]